MREYTKADLRAQAKATQEELDEFKKSGGLAGSLAVSKKSFAGMYKDRFGNEVTLTPDGLAKIITKSKIGHGKWIVKDGRCEVKWESGWTDLLEFDKDGKDLIGDSVSPKGKSTEIKYVAVPPKK